MTAYQWIEKFYPRRNTINHGHYTPPVVADYRTVSGSCFFPKDIWSYIYHKLVGRNIIQCNVDNSNWPDSKVTETIIGQLPGGLINFKFEWNDGSEEGYYENLVITESQKLGLEIMVKIADQAKDNINRIVYGS